MNDELPDTDRPTERQLSYAASLGVQVVPGMTKWQLSNAISDAEFKKKVGPEVYEHHRQWDQCVEKYRYALVVYVRRKVTIVDVLDFSGTDVNARGEIYFNVAAPKLVKDPDLGRTFEWEKHFELPLKSMLYYEPLAIDHTFCILEEDFPIYGEIVERGLAIARDPSFKRKVSPRLP